MGTNYKLDNCRFEPKKESKMEKKSVSITFRTTETNDKFLKELASSEKLTPSYVLNRMIDSWREKKIKNPMEIK